MVYRAIQQGINRHVALKVLRPKRALSGVDLVERFRQEALHTSRLSHPNTITVIDFGETDAGLLYLVTEFLHGETLRDRLRRERTLTPSASVGIAKQVAKSLGEAHAVGIVHGDVKPENIFLCRVAGEAQAVVKVLDFGIARLVGETGEKAMGTPQYMSPEHFMREPLSPASDTYALGIILYEMVRGRRPFDGGDIGALFRRQVLEKIPELPPRLAASKLGEVILKSTSKRPEQRYSNGIAMAGALDEMRSSSKTPRAVFLDPDEDDSLHETLFSADAWEAATGALTTALGGDLPTHGPRPPRLSSAPRISGAKSFVGRREEQAWLLDQVQRVDKEGRGRVLILGGRTGVGKSRLMRWLLEDAALPKAFACGRGRASSRGMFGLAEAVADALGRRRDGPEFALPKLVDRVDDVLGESFGSEEIDVFMALFTGEPVRKRRLAQLLLDVAVRRPLLLYLDDAQAAGPELTEFIEAVAHLMGPVSAPLVLVLSLQREALCLEPPIGRLAATLAKEYPDRVLPRAIGPLARSDADVLARLVVETGAATGDRLAVVGRELLAYLTRRAGRHPELIEAFSTQVLERGLLVRGADGLALKAGTEHELVIPPRLSQAARLPLGFLGTHHPWGPDMERLAHLLALLGDETPRPLLEAYVETAGGVSRPMTQLIRSLRKHDILRSEELDSIGDPLISFTWSTLRVALVEAIDEWPDAGKLHRLAGATKQVYYAQLGELGDHLADIESHHRRADRLAN